MQTSIVSVGDIVTASTKRNLPIPVLYEASIVAGQARLAQGGSLVVSTGAHTGRSPKDRFIVESDRTRYTVDWNETNQPISRSAYLRLKNATLDHLSRQSCCVQDLIASADPRFHLPIRVVTPSAWHALFAETMFIRSDSGWSGSKSPHFTIVHAPHFHPNPQEFDLRSSTHIVIDFDDAIILIGGTEYAGEIKKSVFSVLNFLLPERGVLPMHCSCNVGAGGDVALFFGLSGTGKTTLSADPDRTLVGDDEHGWSDSGIFNFEGGCYAKVIGLRESLEPEIYATTHMFGTILENVVLDPDTRSIDFQDNRFTENTRAAYPLSSIPNASSIGLAGHPRNVIMLTADAFGVLPPVSRLTVDQALYYFLSGYTSKVAGTEIGIVDPEAVFSAGFGAPFLPRRPTEYANLLSDCLETYGATAWLVNTGWTGGSFGTGNRIPLESTRAIITAILDGGLESVEWEVDPVFGLSIPVRCPGVPDELLLPAGTWSNRAAYEAVASQLAGMFARNFERFDSEAHARIRNAGPRSPH